MRAADPASFLQAEAAVVAVALVVLYLAMTIAVSRVAYARERLEILAEALDLDPRHNSFILLGEVVVALMVVLVTLPFRIR